MLTCSCDHVLQFLCLCDHEMQFVKFKFEDHFLNSVISTMTIHKKILTIYCFQSDVFWGHGIWNCSCRMSKVSMEFSFFDRGTTEWLSIRTAVAQIIRRYLKSIDNYRLFKRNFQKLKYLKIKSA